tara:strand:+ start:1450 stop:3120 length:1671 start_codon:yes stop_codon:yes gene_type:complete
MASLTGQSIASTYPLLLKVTDTGIDGTLRVIEDGDATASALKISTAGIQSTGTLTINGTSTLTGDVTLGAALTVGTNIAFATTDTSFTGANRVVFKANVNQSLNIRLQADDGTDNSDSWEIQIADGDAFKIRSKASGSYVDKLSLASNGDVLMAATGKLRLDGSASGDTYIVESSANTLDFYAGGTNSLRITSTHVNIGTSQLAFTSDSGTEVAFSSDNIANISATGGFYVTTGAVTDKEIHLGTNGQTDSFVLDSSENVTIQGTLTAATGVTLSGGASTMTVSDTAHNAVGSSLSIEAGDTTAGTTNNIAGGALNLRGGRGKGSGAGGDIIFQVANAGSSGSVINSWATALTIDDSTAATFNSTITCTTLTANGITSTAASDITMYAKKSFFVILDSDDDVDEVAHNSTFTVKDHDSASLFNVDESGNTTIAGNVTITDATDGLIHTNSGTVTQATDHTTGVTINATSGVIQLAAVTLASTTNAEFTVTNSTVQTDSVILVTVQDENITNNVQLAAAVHTITNGSFKISLVNPHSAGGAASAAASKIHFLVINNS